MNPDQNKLEAVERGTEIRKRLCFSFYTADNNDVNVNSDEPCCVINKWQRVGSTTISEMDP
jgi:hypothetical protein